MANYNKSVNFAVKDTLQSGDPNKIVSGAEIDTEFNNISSASTTKIDKVTAAVTSNLASFTASGALQDSGKDVTDFADATDTENRLSTNESDISDLQSDKANKVSGGVNGNFASLDSSGDIQDSGETATTIINISSPTGAVTAFAANTAPTGWLECDGFAVNRTTYADLFAVIGTTFGVGDASTTFNLPDLRGEFIRGWDDGRGVDSGRAFGSTQSDELKSHSHQVKGEASFQDGGGALTDGNNSGPSTTVQSEPTGGNETRPRNIALLYIIKT